MEEFILFIIAAIFCIAILATMVVVGASIWTLAFAFVGIAISKTVAVIIAVVLLLIMAAAAAAAN